MVQCSYTECGEVAASCIDSVFLMCRSDADDGVYMAFGLSENPMRTIMQGADVTVAWVNRMSIANAVDYHLSGYIQVSPACNRHDVMDY